MRSTLAKIALLIATVLPILYMVVFIAFFVRSILSPGGEMPIIHAHFQLFFVAHLLVMAWSLGLLVIYVIHLFRSRTTPDAYKALWAVLFFFGAQLAMLVYWFLFIWPEEKSKAVT